MMNPIDIQSDSDAEKHAAQVVARMLRARAKAQHQAFENVIGRIEEKDLTEEEESTLRAALAGHVREYEE